MKSFYDKVSSILEEAVTANYGLKLKHPLWEVPQKQNFGDLSSMAALRIASEIKENPLDIAAKIKLNLEKELKGEVAKIEILRPGFINIFISQKALVKSLNAILKSGGSFFSQGKDKRKILIEFLSANPTGPLSIAHGRQAVVGDTIANILEFFGNKVLREYYLNDEGRQIELLVESVKARAGQIQGKSIELPEGGYKGDYIKDMAAELLKRKAKDTRKFSLDYALSLIKKDLSDLGINFDSWFSQKKLMDKGNVAKAMEALKKKGLIYEKEGALWFSSTRFGDDKDRVIKKADGELTYFASDIAYHKDKAGRGYKELINLWGPDHHGYIKRVKTSLEAMGLSQKMLKIIIIQLVTLKSKAKMSKRAGTMILLADLIRDVGPDTARFYYLTRKNSSHLEFDIDLAKAASFDNPLYYIQYSCARIESIFRKAGTASPKPVKSKLIDQDEELNLLRTALQFSYCLEKACGALEPVFIIEFLKGLASAFHKFYEKVRVLDSDKSKQQARLNLLFGVKAVFHCGLNLLGIKPLQRM